MAPALPIPDEMSLEIAMLEKLIQEINSETELLKKKSVEIQAGIDGLIRKQIGIRGLLSLEKAKFQNFAMSRSNVTDDSRPNTAAHGNVGAASNVSGNPLEMIICSNIPESSTYAQQPASGDTSTARPVSRLKSSGRTSVSNDICQHSERNLSATVTASHRFNSTGENRSDRLSTAPYPADSSVMCESGGAGAASILSELDDDRVSWPSDGEMTVLRVKARGQSILCNEGHLCWPAAPRVHRPIPPAGSVVITLPDANGSLVNLAAPASGVTPDGETLLVPLSSWSTRSISWSDTVQETVPNPKVSHPTKNSETQPAQPMAGLTQDEVSGPPTPRPKFWSGFITKLCCGGGNDR